MEYSIYPLKDPDKPIKVPSNPFWDVFKRFGRDEFISMLINVAGTAAAETLMRGSLGRTLGKTARDWILAWTGPVVEKLGFFPGHMKDAHDVYKRTPEKERKKIGYYFKRTFKGGMTSLIEDILVHDPIYAVLMLLGLHVYTETPAWILSTTSFILAVLAVSGLEVGIHEARYWSLKSRLYKMGFGKESYYESRFLIRANRNPDKVVNRVVKEFGLPKPQAIEYFDKYFNNSMSSYSNRTPKLRLRKRSLPDGGWSQSAQITFTRATEMSQEKHDQFRYFPVRKDKLYFMLDQKMPSELKEIRDPQVKRFLERTLKGEESKEVHFTRLVSYAPSAFLISADRIQGNRPFFVVEIKTYRNIRLLKEVMRFVMREFPVVQTTHGKLDLTLFQRN